MKAKFELKQEVWTVENFKSVKHYVYRRQSSVSTTGKAVHTYDLVKDISYMYEQNSISRNEENIFSTKDELIASL